MLPISGYCWWCFQRTTARYTKQTVPSPVHARPLSGTACWWILSLIEYQHCRSSVQPLVYSTRNTRALLLQLLRDACVRNVSLVLVNGSGRSCFARPLARFGHGPCSTSRRTANSPPGYPRPSTDRFSCFKFELMRRYRAICTDKYRGIIRAVSTAVPACKTGNATVTQTSSYNSTVRERQEVRMPRLESANMLGAGTTVCTM